MPPILVALASALVPLIGLSTLYLCLPVLAPMLPFIILGNAVLVVVFGGWLKESSYWVRLAAASVLKFALIYASSLLVIKLIVNETVAASAATMMSWPQLVTAVGGGLLAFGILKFRKSPQ